MPKVRKNEVHLAGELVEESITRTVGTGKKASALSVATKYKDSTEYHRVVCWELLADKAEKLHNGNFVQIVGRLQTRSWQDKTTNQKRYVTEIVAWQLVVPERDPVTTNAQGLQVSDEDIPF